MTSPNMSAQHIGQHSPALRTKPQDQQGQSCFLFAPNGNLSSFNEGTSSRAAGTFSEVSTSSDAQIFGFKPFLRSTMTASVLSSLRLVHSLNVLLLVWTGLSSCSPIKSTENHHRATAGRDAADNQLFDAQSFLSQFLSTLNLTKLRPHTRPLAVHEEPPEYMLELYKRFANDRTAVPSANIVRSFKNEGTTFFNTMKFLTFYFFSHR